jgi:Heavy metal associated domain 2
VKHHAKVAHHVPGRLRVKIDAANPALLESVKQAFAGVPGIDAIIVKPDSGSLVLHYDPRLEAEIEARFATHSRGHVEVGGERPGDEIEALARKLEAEAEFLAGRSQWAHAAVEFFKQFDRQIRAATDNTIDLKIVLTLGLAVVTLVGVGAAAATPMWITLVLFALNHFIEQHPLPAPATVTA